jgi:nitric oxide reductase NorD protein
VTGTPAPEAARFRLLASAIAGRALDVMPAAVGEATWTDGATIFLRVDGAHLEEVVVQAGLLSAGSLGREVTSILAKRPAMVPRYLSTEGHRVLALLEDLLPSKVTRVIDHDTAARSASPADSLALAMSKAAVPDPPPSFGTIRPRQLRPWAEDESVPQPGAQGSAKSSRAAEALRELTEEEQAETLDLSFLSSPGGKGGPIGRILRRFLHDSASTGSRGGSPGAEPPSRWARSGRAGNQGRVMTRSASFLEAPDLHASTGVSYPEWDLYRQAYRPQWCTVNEVAPEPTEGAVPRVAHSTALRRPLARLAMDLERRHRQVHGDDIDLDSMIETIVQLRAGSSTDEAVYLSSPRSRRDIAVMILLDVSGSAGVPSPAGGTVHDHQVAVAAAIAATLHDLGDRVAVYAFRSQGRTEVGVTPVKRFSQPFDPAVMRRFGGLQPGAYTRLGAAIRHGSAVLEAGGGASRRLLITVSDGFAYDHGYEAEYGEADARRALAEARMRGIGCVCLSVGASTEPEALRRVFGTAAQASIPHPDALPTVVGPLLRMALRSADVKRRGSRGTRRAHQQVDLERRSA